MGELARVGRPPAARLKRQRTLQIEYSGNLIKHLGLQMYAGAVPALAELVANAWDADATRVSIDIPFGQSLGGGHVIVVRDDGRGMSWEQVALEYLVIGRERRVAKGTKTPNGRLVMGRKGIGKLAGFGIANIVEVRTVQNKWVTHFEMNYRDMTRAHRTSHMERYEPVVLADERCNEPNGTTITLRELLITRSISEDDFRLSMARRFAVLNNQFQVRVNSKAVQPGHVDLRYRTPERGLNTTHVPGFGKVRWWMGVTRDTIKTPEGRGVAIFAHGKLVQTPFLFNIHGGMHAQLFTQYLTGEFFADRLDEDEDYIATGRQSVNWDEPVPQALERWGQGVLKEYIARSYKRSEQEADTKSFASLDALLDGKLTERLHRLPDSEQRQARALVSSLRKIRETDSSKDYAASVADGIVSIYEGGVGNWSPARALDDDRVITEYGPFDAIRVRSLLRDRSEFLKQLRSRLREARPNLDRADILRGNLWLATGAATLPIEDPELAKAVRQKWRLKNRSAADRVDIIAGRLSSGRFVVAIERSKPTADALQRWKDYLEWIGGDYHDVSIYYVAYRPTEKLGQNGIVFGSLDQFCKSGSTALRGLTRLVSDSESTESLPR